MNTFWVHMAALPEAERFTEVESYLHARGVEGSARLAPVFARMSRLPVFATAADRVLGLVARAASPTRAMLALEDGVLSLESSRGDASPLFVNPILALLIELSGASGRAARLFSRDPALVVELAFREQVRAERGTPDHFLAAKRLAHASGTDTDAFDRLIRRYRNRQMLSIALAELREGDVRHSSAELADLASAAFQAALWHHVPLMESLVGRPDPPCAHSVIGMGKLGGRELNFASDVDVIYFFEHDEGRAGELSLHQFHVKLFERVTASIGRITDHGFVFRVDLDLRPEGRTGTLANSVVSAERYYESWGRTWERAAWVRGRPIAGDPYLGQRLVEMMRPFVYPKNLDFRSIDEIFEMKRKIDDARKRAALRPMGSGLNLKLGLGGIREIEFFAQALQLLYGGREPALRQTNTLEALLRLEAAGIIAARTRAVLGDAYLFLRKVEHRIQIVEEQQTHTLPLDADSRTAIARSLGFSDGDALEQALLRHMQGVHALFVQQIGKGSEVEPLPRAVEVLTDAQASDQDKLQVLTEEGLTDPQGALTNLARASMLPASPLHAHAAFEKRNLGQRLLAECLGSPNQDRALRHLPDLIRSLVMHESYLESLERPLLRRGVARVLGASDLLARILVSNPALLPNVLLEDKLPTPDALETDLKARLVEAGQNIELKLAILRSVKQEETLRIATADLAALIDASEVGERLTVLAEILIRSAFALAEQEMLARYGEPKPTHGLQPEIAIIAGGTLGACEMGYRSDVDLSIIYDGEAETTGGDREPITSAELYTRIAQRLLSFLTLKMREGDLYAVDTRLRPSGNKGALVASLANFEAYHEKTAQLWERQALIRSRAVAGGTKLRARVDRAIQRAAYDAGPVPDAAKRVHEMRMRMEKERSLPLLRRKRGKSESEQIDLKLGKGGLVEVEFLVQYMLIQHGQAYPQVRSVSTRQALHALGVAGLISAVRADRLVRAVDRLRAIQNWLRLLHDAAIDHMDLSSEALRPLSLAVGYQGENAQTLLLRDLRSDLNIVHQLYSEYLGAEA